MYVTAPVLTTVGEIPDSTQSLILSLPGDPSMIFLKNVSTVILFQTVSLCFITSLINFTLDYFRLF